MIFSNRNKKVKIQTPESLRVARSNLDKAFNLASRVQMDFISIGVNSMDIKKDEWVDVPKEIGFKVRIMGLHLGDDYISLLVHYLRNGFMYPHYHENHHETIELLEGAMMNVVNKEKYEQGDVIFIPKEENHHMVSLNGEESYMYVKLSQNKKNIKPVATELKNWEKYKETE